MPDPDKGWQLPTVVSPTDFWCYRIFIPKDVAYLRAFRGAVGELAYNWNWQRDIDHTAAVVVQNWIDQIVQADSEFEASEGECMPTCDEILQCILDTEAIQQAIANYSGQSNITYNTIESATNLSGQLVNNPAGCDNDIIYGMAKQLVEFSDRLIKDLFEKVKSTNLASENIGYLIGLIPVVETLPIDELFELGMKLAEDMEVAYLSASTELLKTEIACELFCLAQANDCVLTLEMVRDYYQVKADIVFSYDSVGQFMLDFVAGTFVGNAVYYAMNIFFFQIFAFGGKFVGYLFSDYLRIINAMFNDPDPDWVTECDDCPTAWEFTFDFTEDNGGWTPVSSPNGQRGTYVASTGWSTTDVLVSGTYRRGLFISKTFTEVEITAISMTFDYEKGSPTGDDQAGHGIYHYNDSTLISSNILLIGSCVNGDDQTFAYNVADTIDEIRLLLTPMAWSSPSYTGVALLKSVTIQGIGTNPFE
jgi:hypothetical protein